MDIRSIGASEDRLRLIFNPARLSARAMEKAENKAKNIATNYVRNLRKHIREQDYVWPALNVDYLDYKKRMGLDERMWIATGKLYKQIRVSRGISSNGRVGYFGGVRKDEIHHYTSKGDPVYTWWIMMALEYGNMRMGIPPRPLFEPALRETMDRERQRYAP